MIDTCAFCRNRRELRESHIIPKFVLDWLKETSGTGYLRFSHSPNKREQDGPKIPLLCNDCERTFGVWETQVSKNIFRPLHDDPGKRLRYQKWLAKFCASVAWRVVTFFNSKGGFTHFSNELKGSKEKALQRWKDFLTDKESNPGPFEFHLLPLEGIADTSDPDMPSNISRYFLRSVDIDAVRSKTSAFVYAKMCHLLLVAFIEMDSAKHWRGTKVHINKGFIGGRVDYHLPGNFAEYLKSRARMCKQALESISKRQWQKITEAYQKDLDRAANSESFRAMNLDVSLFGQAAFEKKERDQ
jgi:hypothetical protein